MLVYYDFFAYGPGSTSIDVTNAPAYRHVIGPLAGGHAIQIIGYTVDGFICKNSWGTNWGYNGFFKIAFSEVDSTTLFGRWTVAYDYTPPDSGFSKHGPPFTHLYDTLSYVLTVTNGSSQTMGDITVQETYPDGPSLESAIPPPTGGDNAWFIPTLAPAKATNIIVNLLVLWPNSPLINHGLASWAFEGLPQEPVQASTTTFVQPTTIVTMPVYQVTGTGPSLADVTNLANAFALPPGSLSLQDGVISFTDTNRFSALPTLSVTNGQAVFQGLDLAALINLNTLDDASALADATNRFANAGISPEGYESITHLAFEGSCTNTNGAPLSFTNNLDTEVQFNFQLGGTPLEGPGAKLRVVYPGSSNSPTTSASFLLYSARQLGPLTNVGIITSAEASNHCAQLYGVDLNPQVWTRLIYYAPPLWATNVNLIIPCYQCGGTAFVNGAMVTLPMQIISAITNDADNGPNVTLSATASTNGQVTATATLPIGGHPPYSYLWSSALVDLSSMRSSDITYCTIPQALVNLQVTNLGNGLVRISWAGPAAQLQSSTNMLQWSPVMEPFVATNGRVSYTVGISSNQTRLFRIPPLSAVQTTDTVAVVVTDANGLQAQASQSVVTLAFPPVPNQNPMDDSPGYTAYGLEGNYGSPAGAVFSSIMRADGVCKQFDGDSWTDFAAPPEAPGYHCVDSADLILYLWNGGSPDSIQSSDGQLFYDAPRLYEAWGDGDLEWLALLSSSTLAYYNSQGICWSNRWTLPFNKLHFLLGFDGDTQPLPAFTAKFAKDMLAGKTICQAWLGSSYVCQGNWTTAVAMGAFGPWLTALTPDGPKHILTFNLPDHFWNKGAVTPDIPADQISGWWRLAPRASP
jgi:hypothetical protein